MLFALVLGMAMGRWAMPMGMGRVTGVRRPRCAQPCTA